jgi:hypothetical protein
VHETEHAITVDTMDENGPALDLTRVETMDAHGLAIDSTTLGTTDEHWQAMDGQHAAKDAMDEPGVGDGQPPKKPSRMKARPSWT